MLVVVGLSHRTAPVEVRERLAVSSDQMSAVLGAFAGRPSVGEVMCVSTCNRVEVIATPPPGSQASLDHVAEELMGALEGLAAPGAGAVLRSHLYRKVGKDAILHLFRVASSLDSIVVGEPQILGQVKQAFESAQAAGTVGPGLQRVVGRALQAAKRVRSETAIGEGQVSIASVAVDLARQIFGELKGHRALLVGAGQMAEGAAQLVVRAGARLDVINRSSERAAALARELGAGVRDWAELPSAIVDTDVVISSTSAPGFVLTHDVVSRAVKMRKGRTLFFIDIAVPRDIEPSVETLNNVFLYDVDDLEGVVRETFREREGEAKRAEQLVLEEINSFDAWVETQSVVPTVVALRAKARSALITELERSLSGKLKHLGQAERAALEVMVDAAVNKLLHAPVARLKRAAGEPRGEQMAQIVRELFDLPDVTVVSSEAAGANAAGSSRPQGGQ
jgi:glutamyl-tRNA reductase